MAQIVFPNVSLVVQNGFINSAGLTCVGADTTTASIAADQATLSLTGAGMAVGSCSLMPSGSYLRVEVNGTFYRMPLYTDA